MAVLSAQLETDILPTDILNVLGYLSENRKVPVRKVYESLDTNKPSADYWLNKLKDSGLIKALLVGTNGNGDEVRLTAFGNDILKKYENKSSLTFADIDAEKRADRNPEICLSLDDINPELKGSLISDAYPGDYGKLSSDLKTQFSTLNDIYYTLYNAQLIIPIASGNTERLVGAALERYFQLGYDVRETKMAPPLEEIVGKKTVLLAASGSGSKYLAADLERFFEAVDKYDLWDASDRNVSTIGISAGLETPIKQWCDMYLVLSGNTKESIESNTNPHKVMGDVFEGKSGATVAIGWKKTKQQKGLSEKDMQKRHKVWS